METSHHVVEHWSSDPAIWVAIAFVIFIVLAGKKIVGFISQFLDEYSVKIKTQLDQAEKLHLEAQNLLQKYTEQSQEAQKLIQEINEHANFEAKKLHEDALANLDINFKRREKAFLEKISLAEKEATQNISDHISKSAINVASEFLRGQLTSAQQKSFIDQSIKDLDRYLVS
ncbi:MAG: hypothetical protein K1X44_00445 [Alphaproteobacteria bacterium]|nr:hypothetical protein [Alphaproteobacteria bacterium]